MSLAIEKTKELNQRLMRDFKLEFKKFPTPNELDKWGTVKFKEFFESFSKEELVEVAVEFNVGLMLEAFRASVINRFSRGEL